MKESEFPIPIRNFIEEFIWDGTIFNFISAVDAGIRLGKRYFILIKIVFDFPFCHLATLKIRKMWSFFTRTAYILIPYHSWTVNLLKFCTGIVIWKLQKIRKEPVHFWHRRVKIELKDNLNLEGENNHSTYLFGDTLLVT